MGSLKVSLKKYLINVYLLFRNGKPVISTALEPTKLGIGTIRQSINHVGLGKRGNINVYMLLKKDYTLKA